MLRLYFGIFLYFPLLCFSCLNSFGASFTIPKGTYQFSADYDGVFQDNKKGDRNRVYGQSLELNNLFGITDSQNVAFNFSANKRDALAVDDDVENTSALLTNAQLTHIINFKVSNSVDFGLQNTLAMIGNGTTGGYNNRWDLKAMIRHDSPSGFYKHSRVELLLRRNFRGTVADAARLELRVKFRITDKVDFSTKLHVYAEFASQSFLDANPSEVTEGRVNPYSLRTFYTSRTEIFLGPDFTLPNKDSVYLHYKMQLDASARNRNHFKGFAIGYSRLIDLK